MMHATLQYTRYIMIHATSHVGLYLFNEFFIYVAVHSMKKEELAIQLPSRRGNIQVEVKCTVKMLLGHTPCSLIKWPLLIQLLSLHVHEHYWDVVLEGFAIFASTLLFLLTKLRGHMVSCCTPLYCMFFHTLVFLHVALCTYMNIVASPFQLHSSVSPIKKSNMRSVSVILK
jgi:hypothetical protein